MDIVEASGDKLIMMPPGTTAWIDQALIGKTIAVWQPYYAAPLSAEDAVEMLVSVSRLFGALRTLAPPLDD
jgi:hypothetical protein